MHMTINNLIRCLKRYKKCQKKQWQEFYYVHKVIGHLGKIEIEKDIIKCYVKQSVLQNELAEIYFNAYDLNSNFIHSDLKKVLDLAKPIVYIFDNLTFSKRQEFLVAQNVILYFHQCNFLKDICFVNGQTVIFNDCKYLKRSSNFYGTCNIVGDVKKFTIKNDRYFEENNHPLNHHPARICFDMEVDEFNVYNSNLRLGNNAYFMINANKVHIQNSSIIAPDIFIATKDITFNQAKLSASNQISLDAVSSKILGCEFDSLKIIINGQEIFQERKSLNNNDNPKVLLLGVLKELYKKCLLEQSRQCSCLSIDSILQRKK